jgi:stress response protein SCP2
MAIVWHDPGHDSDDQGRQSACRRIRVARHPAVVGRGRRLPDADASALLLERDGQVSDDVDFVYYNQAQQPAGAVRHLGKSGAAQFTDVMEIDLAEVPAGFDKVVLAASAGGATFG